MSISEKEKLGVALKRISFSRMRTWQSGKKLFEDTYFLGKKFNSRYMRFGKSMDDLLTGLREPEGLAEQSIFDRHAVDITESPERELKAVFNYKDKDYDLLGYADVDTGSEFVERKTGITKSCYKHAKDQLMFYDFIRMIDGNDPYLKGKIVWIKTAEDVDKKIVSTGESELISVVWTNEHLKQVQKKVEIFINEVSIAYGR